MDRASVQEPTPRQTGPTGGQDAVATVTNGRCCRRPSSPRPDRRGSRGDGVCVWRERGPRTAPTEKETQSVDPPVAGKDRRL